MGGANGHNFRPAPSAARLRCPPPGDVRQRRPCGAVRHPAPQRPRVRYDVRRRDRPRLWCGATTGAALGVRCDVRRYACVVRCDVRRHVCHAVRAIRRRSCRPVPRLSCGVPSGAATAPRLRSPSPPFFRPIWSGRVDLNHRPLDPQSSALTRLRYAPSPHSDGEAAVRTRTLTGAFGFAREERTAA